MSLVVNSNIAGLNAQRNLGISNSRLSKSLERLSSGLRINKASDDAAGLAIATKMSAQVRGLNQAVRNSNNAITLTQTAEGGINTVTNILQRLRELAVQSSSDDNTTNDRANLVNESDNLVAELTRIVNTSEYNGMRLLDGSFSSKYFQVGANYGQNITFSISDTRGSSLGNIAKQDFDIADGVTSSVDAGFTTGEFMINSTNVAATNATDDQYSVLDFSSVQIGTLAVSEFALNADLSGVGSVGSSIVFSLNLTINSVAVAATFSYTVASDTSFESWGAVTSALATGASIAAGIVEAVNNSASLTALNITAKQLGSEGWMVERTGGGDIALLASAYGYTSGANSTGEVSAAHYSAFMGAIAASTLSLMGDGTTHATMASAPTLTNGQSSSIAKAAAINQIKNTSGVDAAAKANSIEFTNAVVGGTAISTGDIYINGVDLGSVSGTANSDTTGSLATAINAISSDTGVTATVDSTSGQLTLSSADGRNITITTATTGSGSGAEVLGLGTGSGHLNNTWVYRGEVTLVDSSAISLTGTLQDLYYETTSTTKTDDVANTVALDTTQNVANVDISTRANAQDAILVVDSALDTVNGVRAEIGAVQNRLEFTVANLQIASENMSAAESRIRDADFASETASFTRNQIMVQAATAILAQANTMPQLALQLLG